MPCSIVAMKLQSCFIIFLACLSLSKCQFARTYPRSVFENVGLGEPPKGVFIPQDSFLNAIRNPSYRTSISPQNTQISPPITYGYSAQQQPFFVQAPPQTPTNAQQDIMLPSDMNIQDIQENTDERGTRRRKIHRRRRIFNEQMGSPQVYSPPNFQNAPLAGVPEGVYIPPDSLLNALHNPSRSRNVYQAPAPAPSVESNFGLMGSNGNNRPQQQFFAQPMTNEQQQQTNIVLPTSSNVQYAAPPEDAAGEEYGTRRTSRKRQTSTQRSRMVPVRLPSLVLDPSMEYPADKPLEERQPLPRTVEEYYDLEVKKTEPSSVTRTTRRKSSQRRKPQTRVKADYVEPVYPPRSYTPSIFQNIGLGEAPNGVYIPNDSLLNVLRDPNTQSQMSGRNDLPHEQPLDARAIPETYMQDVQISRDVQTRRNVSRQRSRQISSCDTTMDEEYGSRSRQQEPAQSSQERRRSNRRGSASNRRFRDEE